MAELKTKKNDASVDDFINSIEDARKRDDSFALLELYKRATGEQPKMWGAAIIGFGQYHYKSERSSQEGDWPLAAFSPRKQSLTLYVHPNSSDIDALLAQLGKFKTSTGEHAGCLYITKLDNVDMNVLEKIVSRAYESSKKRLLK